MKVGRVFFVCLGVGGCDLLIILGGFWEWGGELFVMM